MLRGRQRQKTNIAAFSGEEASMFTQILDPTGNLFLTWLVALIPVVLLLFLLAGLRMSAAADESCRNKNCVLV